MSEINNKKKFKSIFSSKDLSIFCEQIAMLIDSGILLYDGIKMLADESSNMKVKKIFQSISDDLLANNSLENALSNTGQFPDYMIYLTSIGSESGTLDKTMRSLAYYYDRQENIKESIKSAILYPSILICMMVAVLLFLSIKVLPIFKAVLNSLGANLSGAAGAIMSAGNFFTRFSAVFAIIIVAVIICIIYFSKSAKGQIRLMSLIWQSKIFETLSVSILTASMSTALSSGLNTDRALELSSAGIINKNIKYKIDECISIIKNEHIGAVEAIEKSKLFTGTSLNILKLGMASGNLDSSMKYISDLFNDNFENMLVRRISFIEPVSVAILSILIGIILISVMLPLLSVMSIIGA